MEEVCFGDVHYEYVSYLVYCSELLLMFCASDHSLAMNQKQETNTSFRWELDVKSAKLNLKVF